MGVGDTEEDLKAHQAFVDFVEKCREIYAKDGKHHTAVDSDVSLAAHHMLHVFDRERG